MTFPHTVGNAPKLLSALEDVTVIAPECATFECSVKPGTEEFEIAWFKGEKELFRGRKYEMLYWDQKASLVIKDADISDAASYRCEIINKLGRTSSTAQLTVHRKRNFQCPLFFLHHPILRVDQCSNGTNVPIRPVFQ